MSYELLQRKLSTARVPEYIPLLIFPKRFCHCSCGKKRLYTNGLAGVKEETAASSPGLDSLTEASLSSLPLITGLSLPLVMAFSEPMASQTLLASSVPPVPALQMEDMGDGSVSPPPESEPRSGQKDSKAEVRRARR